LKTYAHSKGLLPLRHKKPHQNNHNLYHLKLHGLRPIYTVYFEDGYPLQSPDGQPRELSEEHKQLHSVKVLFSHIGIDRTQNPSLLMAHRTKLENKTEAPKKARQPKFSSPRD
jgi:hypothetical protein